MPDLIDLHIACNDPDNGADTGICAALKLGADADLEWGGLDGVPWEDDVDDDLIRVAWLNGDREITIGRFTFRCDGRRRWVGNWCWDATRIALPDARKLAAFLLLHHGPPDASYDDGPFADLAAADELLRVTAGELSVAGHAKEAPSDG